MLILLVSGCVNDLSLKAYCDRSEEAIAQLAEDGSVTTDDKIAISADYVIAQRDEVCK